MMQLDDLMKIMKELRKTQAASSGSRLPPNLGLPAPEAPSPLPQELLLRPNFGLPAPDAPPALPRELQPPARMAQSAFQVGPVNMNVIRGLNRYAQMNSPQAYADQFAGGDLSKVRARTYRDEEGNAYNDYYVNGLLGG